MSDDKVILGTNINPHTLIAVAVSKKVKEKNYTDVSCVNTLKGITLVLYCQAKEEVMADANIAWGSDKEIALRQTLSKQINLLLDEAVKEYDAILETQNAILKQQNELNLEEKTRIQQKHEAEIKELKIDNSTFSLEAVYKNKQRIINGIFDKLVYTLLAVFVFYLPKILHFLANCIAYIKTLFPN